MNARKKFKKVLLWSHGPWMLISIGALFAPYVLNGDKYSGIGEVVFPFIAFVWSLVYIVIAIAVVNIELMILSWTLYRLDSSPWARWFWCACVIISSIVFASWVLMHFN